MALPDPVMLPDAVAVWRDALAGLSEHASPCRYLTPSRWTDMRAAGLDFLDRFGPEAHRLGWTATDLFGVHPEHGTVRVDWCGALMLSGAKAHGVEAHRVAFERTSAYRNAPGKPVGVPVWVFAARGKP